MTDERQDPRPNPAAAFAGLDRRRWIIIVVVLLAAAGAGAGLALLDREAPSPPSATVPVPSTDADPDAEVAAPADSASADAAPPDPAPVDPAGPDDRSADAAAADQAAVSEAPAPRDVEAAEPAAESPPQPEPAPAVQSAAAAEEPPAGEPVQDEPRPAPAPRRFWADSAVWADLAARESPAPRPVVEAPPPTPVPPVDPAHVGIGPFAMPVAGACFPEFAGQLPGAPRAYRNGIHEGVDFYPGWACAEIARGTPVLAIGEGRVIRADWDYEDLTVELYWEMEARGFAGPDDLDTFRGRQVWVDHGGGVVARYAHLEGIAAGIAEGTPVAAGDVLGYIGESGTPGALRQPGSEIHLHFELRIGDGYLGEDQGPERALALYRAAFPADR
ncbi:MAG: M23 family metallopeptidase [Chloroflexi bacterium]|nr:M23 family metallopeptidase [Chloroflexota bacterium]